MHILYRCSVKKMLNEIITFGKIGRIITKKVRNPSICAMVTCIYDGGNWWRILQIRSGRRISYLHFEPPNTHFFRKRIEGRQGSKLDLETLWRLCDKYQSHIRLEV